MSEPSKCEATTTPADRVQELREKLGTVTWVAHVSMLSFAGYRRILMDDELRAAVFPTLGAANPTVQHVIEPDGVAFATSLVEVSAPENGDLFNAWQILGALSAMTAVLETYLRRYAMELAGRKIDGVGVLSKVKELGVLRTTTFPGFARLRHFQEVRNISQHNLARINGRFRDKTAEPHHRDGPYTFFPRQINEYQSLILAFVDWCEREAATPPAV